MQQDNFRRLIDLAQKTGDTLIVTDKTGDEPVVIMDVAKYEALLDIGLFAEDSDVSYEDSVTDVSEIEDFDTPLEVYAPTEITPDPSINGGKNADIPPLMGKSEGGSESEDDDGEERFYLEPIE